MEVIDKIILLLLILGLLMVLALFLPRAYEVQSGIYQCRELPEVQEGAVGCTSTCRTYPRDECLLDLSKKYADAMICNEIGNASRRESCICLNKTGYMNAC